MWVKKKVSEMMCCLVPLSAGLLDTRVALNLSQYISREREYVPCTTGLAKLSSIGARLSLTPVYGLYQVNEHCTLEANPVNISNTLDISAQGPGAKLFVYHDCPVVEYHLQDFVLNLTSSLAQEFNFNRTGLSHLQK